MYIVILLKCTKCPKDSVKSLDVHQSVSVHNAPVYSTNCITSVERPLKLISTNRKN